jgi:hypothetical protein
MKDEGGRMKEKLRAFFLFFHPSSFRLHPFLTVVCSYFGALAMQSLLAFRAAASASLRSFPFLVLSALMAAL